MHFDEFSEDQRFTDPKEWFKVLVFYPTVNTTGSHLNNWLESMKSVVDT